MDKKIKALSGSKRCDAFKTYHKTLPKSWYACDGDLFLIDKHEILALLDYKWHDDKIRWSHKKLYRWMIALGIPVFIVEQINEEMEFMIYKYVAHQDTKGRDYYTLDFVSDDFVEFEAELREQANERRTQDD